MNVLKDPNKKHRVIKIRLTLERNQIYISNENQINTKPEELTKAIYITNKMDSRYSSIVTCRSH